MLCQPVGTKQVAPRIGGVQKITAQHKAGVENKLFTRPLFQATVDTKNSYDASRRNLRRRWEINVNLIVLCRKLTNAAPQTPKYDCVKG